ncbi:MAG: hypothetical protein H7319_04060 [Spirosoma sp.]|nr:hypothetical protein [Spirosoma sp.]
MEDSYGRLNSRLQKINEKIAEVDRIVPVDDLHREAIKEARKTLVDRKNEVLADKKIGDDFLTAYREAEQAKLNAKWAEDAFNKANDYHEKLKKWLIQKYAVSKNPTDEERAAYAKSWEAREDAAKINNQRQEDLKKSLDKKKGSLQKYNVVTRKIKYTFPADNDITDECIPCKAVERRRKLERIMAVFPGQQSFGNCGIQSSRQMIDLMSCNKTDEMDETDFFKKALRNGNADLYDKSGKKILQNVDDTANEDTRNKLINDIQPVRKSGDPVSSGGIGQSRGRKADEEAVKHNNKIINTNQTGSSKIPLIRKIIEEEKVFSTEYPHTRNNIEKGLKMNLVMIFAADVSKLGPAEDENGQPVETWLYTDYGFGGNGKIIHKPGDAKQSGGHAVTVADGKFDSSGNLTHVLVSDTGVGMIYYMKIEDFESSLFNDPMVVSDEPMKVNCP